MLTHLTIRLHYCTKMDQWKWKLIYKDENKAMKMAGDDVGRIVKSSQSWAYTSLLDIYLSTSSEINDINLQHICDEIDEDIL